MKLLQLFCEKMFPPSLTHFFRAEQLVRQIALEALQFHLSDTRAETLQQITDKLLTGYHDHLYPLNENDLRDIGLPVTSPNAEETRLLWSIWEHGRAYLDRGQQSSHLSRVHGSSLALIFTLAVLSREVRLSLWNNNVTKRRSSFFHMLTGKS